MKHLSLYIDLAFCLVILPLMVIILPLELWYYRSPWYVYAMVAAMYAIYFVNRFFAVPLLFKGGRRNVSCGVVLILICGGIAAALAGVNLSAREGPGLNGMPVLGPPHNRPMEIPPPKPVQLERQYAPPTDMIVERLFPHVQPHTQAVWTLFVLVETFSFAVTLLMQTNSQKARARAVEAERDHAQVQLYKMQIKPHFMFNTLNSLYGLFLTNNPAALTSLEKFISMMRYMHVNAPRDMVPLGEEADYISQYVELQRLRLNNTTKLDLNINISEPGLKVPPMLLVTFVENCFKHGVSSVVPSTIRITIDEDNGHLLFTTHNAVFKSRSDGEHVGIANCQRRLDLLFPGKYSLDIVREDKFFNVNLKILLQ